MADIIPNAQPSVGSIAIFYYNGIKHVAYTESVGSKGVLISECNMTKRYGVPCGSSFMSFDDPRMKGFYSLK